MRLPNARMYKALVKKSMGSPFGATGTRVSDPYFFGGASSIVHTPASFDPMTGAPIAATDTIAGSFVHAGMMFPSDGYPGNAAAAIPAAHFGRLLAFPVYFVRRATITGLWVRHVSGGDPAVFVDDGGAPLDPTMWNYSAPSAWLVAGVYAPLSDANPYPGAKLVQACKPLLEAGTDLYHAAIRGSMGMPSFDVEAGDVRWIAYAATWGGGGAGPSLTTQSMFEMAPFLGWSAADLAAGPAFGPTIGLSFPLTLPAVDPAPGPYLDVTTRYSATLPATFPTLTGAAGEELKPDELHAVPGPEYLVQFGLTLTGT